MCVIRDGRRALVFAEDIGESVRVHCEVGADAVHGFADAISERVVVIRDDAARRHDGEQAACGVVVIALGHAALGARDETAREVTHERLRTGGGVGVCAVRRVVLRAGRSVGGGRAISLRIVGESERAPAGQRGAYELAR